ncbi:MAG: T9SS type A sorting domain-containing protein [Cyclobacteriaceae bacterium]
MKLNLENPLYGILWGTLIFLCAMPMTASAGQEDCLCEFGIQYMTVRYDGPDGATIKVYATRNQRNFVQQFESVATGELLFIDKSDFLKGSVKTKTYLVVEGEPDSEVSYHTSCSEDILNQTKGYFTVTAFQDAFGHACANELNLSAQVQNNKCHGEQHGEIELKISGGAPPYDISWDDSSVDAVRTQLKDGIYQVTVTDFLGNSLDTAFTISSPDSVQLSGEISLTGCGETGGGAIALSVSGGVTPYQIHWSTGDTTATINELAVGTYHVEVIEDNGCIARETYEIPQVSPISLSIESTSCQDGNLSAIAEGGESPYTYTWSTGDSGSAIVVTTPGKYWVSVTDVSGCVAADTVVIEQLSQIDASAAFTTPSCFGGIDGAIILSISGESSEYTYQWSNGQTTKDLTNVEAGTYQVTISPADGADCSQEFSFTLPDAKPNLVYASVTQINCQGTGSIRIDSLVGAEPFEIEWSTGETSVSVDNLNAGTYGLKVTDGKGCEVSRNFTIVEYQPLQVNIDYDFCITNNLRAIVRGGTGPYTYTWNGVPDNYSVIPDSIGTYEVVVTDSQGCRDSSTVEVTDIFTPLNISGTTTQLSCNDPASGSIELSVSGGEGPYTYTWSNGANESMISGLTSGYYEVTVADQKGCEKSRLFSIRPLETMSLSSDITMPGCEEEDGSISVSVIGGNAPYNFQWNTGVSGPALSNLSEGEYQLTVEDASGCVVMETFALVLPDTCEIPNNDKPADESCCDGRVSQLTLKYQGTESGYVKALQKIDGKIVYSEMVGPGDEFPLYGQDRKGTLGPEIIIYIDGDYAAQFHTSCSEPIGPGSVSGDFLVLSGESRNGGILCPVTEEQTARSLEYNLYPNPYVGSEKLRIKISQSDEQSMSVRLYDLTGKLRATIRKECNPQQSLIDISEITNELPRGQYLMKFNLGTQEFIERLIIK